jgi:hypothetical protein
MHGRSQNFVERVNLVSELSKCRSRFQNFHNRVTGGPLVIGPALTSTRGGLTVTTSTSRAHVTELSQ